MSDRSDNNSARRTTAVAVVAAALAVLVLAGASAGTASPEAPQVTPVACEPDPGYPGAVCGTVDVPLDRAEPPLGTIPIYFEFYPHTDTSQPSLGTIVPSVGGPGISDTFLRGLWLDHFAPVLDRHDLLLIDHRGIGRSAPIDCPALQHFVGDLQSAVRACGVQLGAAASFYGSGDVADDIDDVRAALSIDKLLYYGASYGGVDVRAYAYRHADHLQAAILDSPWTTEDWTFTRADARFYAQAQATVCRRSPSCVAANPHPEATLAWLAQRLRKHPFDGVGYDADGTPHALHVDESTIFAILSNDAILVEPPFLNHGELTAAATALRHGDETPLLRLAAESPDSTDSGDPSGFTSTGAGVATQCDDGRYAWDTNAPEPVRRAQFEAAFEALPADAYAPFSATAWSEANERLPTGVGGGFPPDGCVAWPAPTRPNPPYPPKQPFPNIPALILGADIDIVSVDDIKASLALFPHGQFVEVANSGHIPFVWSPCALAIELRFIDTLQSGDTSCAGDVKAPFHEAFDQPSNFVPYHGVGSFPLDAGQAQLAMIDPTGSDETTPAQQRVASVAWATVEDAFMRSMRMSGTTGRGLRGGTYTVSHTDTTTSIDYQAVLFSNDVSITGHATLDIATNALVAHVTADGPGNNDGALDIHATLFDPNHPNAQLRGIVKGRQVALLAPTN